MAVLRAALRALIECGRVLAVMRGRMHLSIEDITSAALSVLRHRIILNFDAHADGETTETILDKILKRRGPTIVAAEVVFHG